MQYAVHLACCTLAEAGRSTEVVEHAVCIYQGCTPLISNEVLLRGVSLVLVLHGKY
jgi:hypothetical protein